MVLTMSLYTQYYQVIYHLWPPFYHSITILLLCLDVKFNLSIFKDVWTKPNADLTYGPEDFCQSDSLCARMNMENNNCVFKILLSEKVWLHKHSWKRFWYWQTQHFEQLGGKVTNNLFFWNGFGSCLEIVSFSVRKALKGKN